jgi:hypothetical protein
MKEITINDLRQMDNTEGLILQGCGGDPREWIDGINNMLTDARILLDGSKFTEVSRFEYDGLTNLLFSMDGVKCDGSKLAMWRLQTHEQFGGTWLSDYVPNQLGGFASDEQTQQKPDCPLIGEDGNIFNLMGLASRTLRRNGMSDQATEMCDRIRESGDYYAALGVIGEYVNITSVDEPESGMTMQ